MVEFQGSFLIGQRLPPAPLPGLWEFPGGKLEPGETLVAAAARECFEETGIAIEVGEEFMRIAHDYEHARVELHFFRARPTGARKPSSENYRWVPRADLARFDFLPANAPLIAQLTRGE